MEEKIGVVTHFFNKISCAVLELTAEIKIGDKLHFQGYTTDFTQTVESMQVEHEAVELAKPGMDFAMKVASPVRRGDDVYKVTG